MAKTYPGIGPFAPGDILNAATMTDIQTNLDNTRVPPMCQVRLTSNATSFTSGGTVSWSSAAYDTDGMFTSGTNVTIQTAGVYMVNCYLTVSGAATITDVFAQINKNGNNFGQPHNKSYNGQNVFQTITFVSQFAANDVLTLLVAFNGGSAYVVGGNATEGSNQTRLSVTWLGQAS